MSSTNAENATSRRRYTSSLRSRQAAETRSQVLNAASECFAESGYAGTTLAEVADRAGVAVETVYSRFKSKKRLLREAIDVAIAGDAEPIPFVERPEFASLGEGTFDERLRRAIAVATEIVSRSFGVWAALMEAATSDDEVERWRVELERNRRDDVGRSLALIVGHTVSRTTVDLVSALIGPSMYATLTQDLGWSRPRYEREITTMAAELLRREDE